MRFLIALAVTAAPFVAWKVAALSEPHDTEEHIVAAVMVFFIGVFGVLALFGLLVLWRWAL